MRRLLVLAVFIASSVAFAETCTLQTYASSWMATGTPFSVKCLSGVYSGHIVSTPARRFFRRGHMMFVFDKPLAVETKGAGSEGKMEPGRGRQIANILTAGGVGIGSKDLLDPLSGAIFKSWYAIPIAGVALAFFSKGGDINLKPGYKLKVVPLRN